MTGDCAGSGGSGDMGSGRGGDMDSGTCLGQRDFNIVHMYLKEEYVCAEDIHPASRPSASTPQYTCSFNRA